MASSGLAMQPINNRMFTWRVFLTENTKHVMSKVLNNKQSNNESTLTIALKHVLHVHQ